MSAALKLTGLRFSKLVVISRLENNFRKTTWLCKCDCGNKVKVMGSDLINEHTRSCGCYQIDRARESAITHGKSKSSTYVSWCGMKNRCSNKKADDYIHYGGRGITVCERWGKFENFLKDMGERPTGKTLDRTDNDGSYSKNNCRWITQKEQCSNTRVNVYVILNGEKTSLPKACKVLNLKRSLIYQRLRRGSTFEEATLIKRRLKV